MKRILKKIYNFLYGTNGIIIIIYTTFIFLAYVLTVNLSLFSNHAIMIAYTLRKFIIIGIIAVIVCPIVLKKLSLIDINKDNSENQNKYIKISLYIIPMLICGFNFIIYYPGGFEYDSVNQYAQAINNTYTDWHPVIETLLAVKLPMIIFRGWIASIAFQQFVTLSLSIGYALNTCFEYTNRKYTFVVLLFYLLNPVTRNISIYIVKDTYFAAGIIILMSLAVKIYFTKGEWIKRVPNLVLFIVVIVLTTLCRHNALLFTFPYFIAVCCLISKKRVLLILLSATVLICGIKYPLYSVIGVQNPSNRQEELLGVPMNIIASVTKNDNSALDSETRDFVNKVAPIELWEKYDYGEYNFVKFEEESNESIVNDYGVQKVLKMAVRTYLNSPYEATMALIKTIEPVFTVSANYKYNKTLPYIHEDAEKYHIKGKGIPVLQRVNWVLTDVEVFLFPHLFLYCGSMHLLLLFVLLAKCSFKRLSDWKKILIVIPTFVYNFGTALLMTGASDSERFFYYTFMIVPLLLIVLMRNEKVMESVTGDEKDS